MLQYAQHLCGISRRVVPVYREIEERNISFYKPRNAAGTVAGHETGVVTEILGRQSSVHTVETRAQGMIRNSDVEKTEFACA